MIKNPVYRREMMVSSRSIRMPLIIAGFNLILATFALFGMLANVSSARVSAQINYSTFLLIFRYVACIEFILVLFTVPALTAGSISGEREHRTLDLMLTTKLTPARIVIGKMMTSITTVCLLVISSLPILALVFAYGGVTVLDILLLFAAYFVIAIFTASVGIWASSLSDRSAIATAATYAVLILIIGGTLGACVLATNFVGNADGWVYLLPANPVVTFYGLICNMTGDAGALGDIIRYFNATLPGVTPLRWFILGSAIQLLLSVVLIGLAIRHTGVHKK